MGSATDTRSSFGELTFSKEGYEDDCDDLDSLLQQLSFKDGESTLFKSLFPPNTNGFKGNSSGLCEVSERIRDIGADLGNGLCFSELEPAHLPFSIISDDSEFGRNGDVQGNGFCDVRSLALGLSDGGVLSGELGCIGENISLADLYFSGGSGEKSRDGKSLEEGGLQADGCLEELLAGIGRREPNGETCPTPAVEGDVTDFSGFLAQDGIDNTETLLNLCIGQSSSRSRSESEASEASIDCNFSLADLYFSKKEEEETSIKSTTTSQDEAYVSDYSSKTTETSDEEKENLYDEHDDELLCEVDLSAAAKKLPEESCFQGYANPGSMKHTFKRSPLIKSKPSLFCKVLCTRPRQKDLSSVPRCPSNLSEFLKQMDYCKYFSFDSPSPDDIIKEKQSKAFK